MCSSLFYAVCINGLRYLCCSERFGVSNECDEPTSCLVYLMGVQGGEAMYVGSV